MDKKIILEFIETFKSENIDTKINEKSIGNILRNIVSHVIYLQGKNDPDSKVILLKVTNLLIVLCGHTSQNVRISSTESLNKIVKTLKFRNMNYLLYSLYEVLTQNKNDRSLSISYVIFGQLICFADTSTRKSSAGKVLGIINKILENANEIHLKTFVEHLPNYCYMILKHANPESINQMLIYPLMKKILSSGEFHLKRIYSEALYQVLFLLTKDFSVIDTCSTIVLNGLKSCLILQNPCESSVMISSILSLHRIFILIRLRSRHYSSDAIKRLTFKLLLASLQLIVAQNQTTNISMVSGSALELIREITNSFDNPIFHDCLNCLSDEDRASLVDFYSPDSVTMDNGVTMYPPFGRTNSLSESENQYENIFKFPTSPIDSANTPSDRDLMSPTFFYSQREESETISLTSNNDEILSISDQLLDDSRLLNDQLEATRKRNEKVQPNKLDDAQSFELDEPIKRFSVSSHDISQREDSIEKDAIEKYLSNRYTMEFVIVKVLLTEYHLNQGSINQGRISNRIIALEILTNIARFHHRLSESTPNQSLEEVFNFNEIKSHLLAIFQDHADPSLSGNAGIFLLTIGAFSQDSRTLFDLIEIVERKWNKKPCGVTMNSFIKALHIINESIQAKEPIREAKKRAELMDLLENLLIRNLFNFTRHNYRVVRKNFLSFLTQLNWRELFKVCQIREKTSPVIRGTTLIEKIYYECLLHEIEEDSSVRLLANRVISSIIQQVPLGQISDVHKEFREHDRFVYFQNTLNHRSQLSGTYYSILNGLEPSYDITKVPKDQTTFLYRNNLTQIGFEERLKYCVESIFRFPLISGSKECSNTLHGIIGCLKTLFSNENIFLNSWLWSQQKDPDNRQHFTSILWYLLSLLNNSNQFLINDVKLHEDVLIMTTTFIQRIHIIWLMNDRVPFGNVKMELPDKTILKHLSTTLLQHILRMLSIYTHIFMDIKTVSMLKSTTRNSNIRNFDVKGNIKKMTSKYQRRSLTEDQLEVNKLLEEGKFEENTSTGGYDVCYGNSKAGTLLDFKILSNEEALGYFDNQLHYRELHSRIKSSFKAFQINSDLTGKDEKILSLLNTILESLTKLLEVFRFYEISVVSDELNLYLSVIYSWSPSGSIFAIHKLIQAVFGANLTSHWDNEIGHFYRKAFKELEREDHDSQPPSFADYLRIVKTKRSPVMRKKFLETTHTENELNLTIKRFEPIVLRSLKNFKTSNSPRFFVATLTLVIELVGLQINYSELDSDLEFLKDLIRKFSDITETFEERFSLYDESYSEPTAEFGYTSFDSKQSTLEFINLSVKFLLLLTGERFTPVNCESQEFIYTFQTLLSLIGSIKILSNELFEAIFLPIFQHLSGNNQIDHLHKLTQLLCVKKYSQLSACQLILFKGYHYQPADVDPKLFYDLNLNSITAFISYIETSSLEREYHSIITAEFDKFLKHFYQLELDQLTFEQRRSRLLRLVEVIRARIKNGPENDSNIFLHRILLIIHDLDHGLEAIVGIEHLNFMVVGLIGTLKKTSKDRLDFEMIEYLLLALEKNMTLLSNTADLYENIRLFSQQENQYLSQRICDFLKILSQSNDAIRRRHVETVKEQLLMTDVNWSEISRMLEDSFQIMAEHFDPNDLAHVFNSIRTHFGMVNLSSLNIHMRWMFRYIAATRKNEAITICLKELLQIFKRENLPKYLPVQVLLKSFKTKFMDTLSNHICDDEILTKARGEFNENSFMETNHANLLTETNMLAKTVKYIEECLESPCKCPPDALAPLFLIESTPMKVAKEMERLLRDERVLFYPGLLHQLVLLSGRKTDENSQIGMNESFLGDGHLSRDNIQSILFSVHILFSICEEVLIAGVEKTNELFVDNGTLPSNHLRYYNNQIKIMNLLSALNIFARIRRDLPCSDDFTVQNKKKIFIFMENCIKMVVDFLEANARKTLVINLIPDLIRCMNNYYKDESLFEEWFTIKGEAGSARMRQMILFIKQIDIIYEETLWTKRISQKEQDSSIYEELDNLILPAHNIPMHTTDHMISVNSLMFIHRSRHQLSSGRPTNDQDQCIPFKRCLEAATYLNRSRLYRSGYMIGLRLRRNSIHNILKELIIRLCRHSDVLKVLRHPRLTDGDTYSADNYDPKYYTHIDRDSLVELVARINAFGWTSRVMFEQSWMTYLFILNKSILSEKEDETNTSQGYITQAMSVEETIELNHGLCTALNGLGRLLLDASLKPKCGNPIDSVLHHKPTSGKNEFVFTKFGQKLIDVKEILDVAWASVIFQVSDVPLWPNQNSCCSTMKNSLTISSYSDLLNIDLHRMNQPYLDNYNRISHEHTVRKVVDVSRKTNFKDLIETFEDNERDQFDADSSLIYSCLQSIRIIFFNWFSNETEQEDAFINKNSNPTNLYKNISVSVVTEAVKIATILLDTFKTKDQFIWIQNCLMKIYRTQKDQSEIDSPLLHWLIIGLSRSYSLIEAAFTDRESLFDLELTEPIVDLTMKALNKNRSIAIKFAGLHSVKNILSLIVHLQRTQNPVFIKQTMKINPTGSPLLNQLLEHALSFITNEFEDFSSSLITYATKAFNRGHFFKYTEIAKPVHMGAKKNVNFLKRLADLKNSATASVPLLQSLFLNETNLCVNIGSYQLLLLDIGFLLSESCLKFGEFTKIYISPSEIDGFERKFLVSKITAELFNLHKVFLTRNEVYSSEPLFEKLAGTSVNFLGNGQSISATSFAAWTIGIQKMILNQALPVDGVETLLNLITNREKYIKSAIYSLPLLSLHCTSIYFIIPHYINNDSQKRNITQDNFREELLSMSGFSQSLLISLWERLSSSIRKGSMRNSNRTLTMDVCEKIESEYLSIIIPRIIIDTMNATVNYFFKIPSQNIDKDLICLLIDSVMNKCFAELLRIDSPYQKVTANILAKLFNNFLPGTDNLNSISKETQRVICQWINLSTSSIQDMPIDVSTKKWLQSIICSVALTKERDIKYFLPILTNNKTDDFRASGLQKKSISQDILIRAFYEKLIDAQFNFFKDFSGASSLDFFLESFRVENIQLVSQNYKNE